MSSIIKRFKKSEFVVNCKSEEQAKEFIKICYDNGLHWWMTDDSSKTNWDNYEEATCYRAEDNEIMYENVDFYKDEDYEIVSFNTFMWRYRGMKQFTKDDLKAGMLVESRDGELMLAMPSKEGLFFVASHIQHTLTYYDDNLLDVDGDTDLDIVKVYDIASDVGYTLEDLLVADNRVLLWEREEVKELTVDEISKLLGYKVKVVGGKD